MNAIRTFAREHQVLSFYVLAFALSWLVEWPAAARYWQGSARAMTDVLVFALAGSFMVAVSAVTVTALTEGRAGVVALLKKLTVWRVNAGWYLVAVYGPFVAGCLAVLVASLLGLELQ